MAQAVQELLESIPKMVKTKDAAALVELRDHDDRALRKAVRKALHTLRSRGVEIPEGGPKSWQTGDTLKNLRGDLEPCAIVDTASTPGATRFMLSLPDEVDGGRLLVGALGPDDRVVDFGAYRQTDGQRARLLRDWTRRSEDRKVSIDWLKSRIRYAREQTIGGGHSPPRALDEALPLLGDAPAERPYAGFLDDELKDQKPIEAEEVDQTLVSVGVPNWPPVIELDDALQKAAEIHGDKPQPEEESERMELLRQSIAGQESIRNGLQGALANALEDAAVFLWQDGRLGTARAAYDLVRQLRDTADAETLPWAPRLVGYQVASLLRAVGPEAVAKAQAEAARMREGGDEAGQDEEQG